MRCYSAPQDLHLLRVAVAGNAVVFNLRAGVAAGDLNVWFEGEPFLFE